MVKNPARLGLDQTVALLAAGKVKPIVDRVLPLAEAAKAHEYMETHHARGKVILKVL